MLPSQGWHIGVIYKVGGDESHDETKKRVFAIGAVIGSEEEWAAIEPKWIERTGGKPFHAADCETDHGDYEGIPHSENLSLYKDLVSILRESTLYGIGKAIDLANWNTHFPDALRDQPYYYCFSEVVNQCVEVVSMCIPRGRLEVIFDRHPETEYNAGLIYDGIANNPNWKDVATIADKVSFASRQTIAIQVADLVARESMKHMDNLGKRPMRKSMQALVGTGRFQFQLFTENYFIDLKRKVGSLPQHRELWEKYREFLTQTGAQDTGDIRLRFARKSREERRKNETQG